MEWQRLEKESRETEKWGKDKVNYFKISGILDIEKTLLHIGTQGLSLQKTSIIILRDKQKYKMQIEI